MAGSYITPTITELREMLDYNPVTGHMTWKTRPDHHFKNPGIGRAWNARHAGRCTGTPDPDGYLRINIQGIPHLLHQLAWAIYYGEFIPLIDHKNLVHGDNWIDNLRKATHSQNQHNRTINKNNKSGFKGVCWHSKMQKWRAYIVVNWKQKHLGLFDNAEEAHRAYCAAADELHGAFANYGTPMAGTEASDAVVHEGSSPSGHPGHQGSLA